MCFRWLKSLLLGGLLCLTTLMSATSAKSDAQAPLRMGISGFALSEQREQIVAATEKALRPLFGNGRLVVRHYSVQSLERAVKDGDVDIILSSAGLARRVAPYGVRPLVTITSPGLEDPNQNEGALIVVRSERGYHKLSDLKGASVSANLPWGFSGWLIAMGEIAAAGYKPDSFFSEKVFIGRSDAMKDVVTNVLNARVEVGILRLCALESLSETNPALLTQLRVINEQKQQTTACKVSTELYPAQTLSVTPRVNSKTARDMTMHLLEMPPTSTGHSWSIASDFQHVDKLLKNLKIGPYEYLRQWSLNRFLTIAWPWLTIFCFFVLGLLWHNRRADRLLLKRGALLRQMYLRESEQSQKLAFLQRTNTVNQVSSMVAHELRQPLAALTFYADGLAMMLDMRSIDEQKLRRFTAGISKEAKRASDIIGSVHAYAKNRHQPRTAIDVIELLKSAVELFQSGRANKIAVAMRCKKENLRVKGNALELTLVFVNLLKNAREACESVETPRVCIHVEVSQNDPTIVVISVCDNGMGLSDEDLLLLGQPQSSEKPDGLGLGLSIVRTIVEAHGGHLTFKHAAVTEFSGLCASVSLPRLMGDKRENQSHDTDH